jgi:hypothetical protein
MNVLGTILISGLLGLAGIVVAVRPGIVDRILDNQWTRMVEHNKRLGVDLDDGWFETTATVLKILFPAVLLFASIAGFAGAAADLP